MKKLSISTLFLMAILIVGCEKNMDTNTANNFNPKNSIVWNHGNGISFPIGVGNKHNNMLRIIAANMDTSWVDSTVTSRMIRMKSEWSGYANNSLGLTGAELTEFNSDVNDAINNLNTYNTTQDIISHLNKILDTAQYYSILNSTERNLIQRTFNAVFNSNNYNQVKDSLTAIRSSWASITWSGTNGMFSAGFIEICDSSNEYWHSIGAYSITNPKKPQVSVALPAIGAIDAIGFAGGMSYKWVKGLLNGDANSNGYGDQILESGFAGAGGASGGAIGSAGGPGGGILGGLLGEDLGRKLHGWLKSI